MEDDTIVVECLIKFYIGVKHILKTRLPDERTFLHEMVKHCKENGFHSFTDEKIKSTWKKLVSKYMYLKIKGTTDERDNWKYFEVFDSCYEHSDFHNGIRPKFSEDMVWFLIECFWKRKSLNKTHKRTCILNDIHKEFLQCGYLYVTKHDIENKWKYLNSKYEKLKDDPEKLKKLPYLEALSAFHEANESRLINMIFTRELTETLIEFFTKTKVTCIVYGYNSDQVLGDIQSKFKDMGFYFSKEAIEKQWRTLTVIYKFLLTRGNHKTTWIHFESMKNHFKDNSLFSNKKINGQNDDKCRRSRRRLKSVSAEHEKSGNNSDSFIEFEPLKSSVSPKMRFKDHVKINTSEKESVKKSFEIANERDTPKKLKTRSRRKNFENVDKSPKVDVLQSEIIGSGYGRCLRPRSKSVCTGFYREISDEERSKSKFEAMSKKRKTVVKDDVRLSISNKKMQIGNRGFANTSENFENRLSDTVNEAKPQTGPQKEEKGTSVTVNENEFHIININQSDIKRENGSLTINIPPVTKRFSSNEFLPLKKRLRLDAENLNLPVIEIGKQQFHMSVSEHLTDEEVVEIVKQIEKSNLRNSEAKENSSNYFGPEELSKCQILYSNLPGSQIDKSVQNTNSTEQHRVVMLMIKVDRADKTSKDEEKFVRTEDFTKESSETESCDETPVLQLFTELEKPTTLKDAAIIQTETEHPISDMEISCVETNSVHNDGEIISRAADTTNLQNGVYNSAFSQKEYQQDAMYCTNLNNNVPSTMEESEIEHFENTLCEPLPLIEKTLGGIETLSGAAVLASNAKTQSVRHRTYADTVHLPFKSTGKLKQIFISPSELSVISGIKPKVSDSKTSEINENISVKRNVPEFKFISQVVKPATMRNFAEGEPVLDDKANNSQHVDDSYQLTPEPLATDQKLAETTGSLFQNRIGKIEEFENDSVFSEALGDDGLKDNLLATVIDFQEQNNREFIEIKNLMKQNNLLQRETNRLLRLFLEGL